MNPFPEHLLRLAEALIFASAEPVTPATLASCLGPKIDVHRLADVLIDRHAGKGFELVAASGGWHFRTASEADPAHPGVPAPAEFHLVRVGPQRFGLEVEQDQAGIEPNGTPTNSNSLVSPIGRRPGSTTSFIQSELTTQALSAACRRCGWAHCAHPG